MRFRKARTPEEANRRRIRKDINAYIRNVRRGTVKGKPGVRKRWLLLLGLGLSPLLMGAGWRCDSPTKTTWIDGEHVDYDDVSAYDSVCRLIGGCPGWHEPGAHLWWHEEYFVLMPWGWQDSGVGAWRGVFCPYQGSGCSGPIPSQTIWYHG